MHGGLTDKIFRSAPGSWDLYECRQCQSAYLDPRPTQATIHEAYGNYYTHEPRELKQTAPRGTIRRIFLAITNAYRNTRFGTSCTPASRFGFVARLIPGKRRAIEREFRHLPKVFPGASLLDVGCGSGAFLLLAKRAGWSVYGCEPDPQATQVAREVGLTVRQGGIEAFKDMPISFDVITLGHVIEHVHNPKALLEEAHHLLKPGGMVWLETPNIRSFGHRHYGPNWRGLEPPRHLVIFTRRSLDQLLQETGFGSFTWFPRTDLYTKLAKSSDAIKNGQDPYAKRPTTFVEHIYGRVMHLRTLFFPERAEYITLTAKKS